jgi:hypothetical protein
MTPSFCLVRQSSSELGSALSYRKNYYIFFAPFGRAQASLALHSLIAKIIASFFAPFGRTQSSLALRSLIAKINP